MSIFKNYLKKIYMVFMVVLFGLNMPSLFGMAAQKNQAVGQLRLERARELSLARQQKAEGKKARVDTRTLQEIEDSTASDLFTQTEAYFQIPELRKLVTEHFKGSFEVVGHMDVVSRVMAKEAQFRNSHWAFYHGVSNVWNVWQDAYTKLYNHFNPSAHKRSEDFIFLRVSSQEAPGAKEFLISELKKNGLVDDTGELKGLLLPVNLSLFGNTNAKGESAWHYFMANKTHEEPGRDKYQIMMDEFKLPYTYINELMALTKLLQSKHQALLQIFVPKDSIDDVAYVSWMAGMPFHEESINWIRTNLKNKVYRGKAGKPGRAWALADLKAKFKKQQEKNPLFKSMLEEVEQGDYSVNAFLKVYCNKPWELPNLDYAQARLLLSNDLLLDPTSGVKIFRHTEINESKMEEYEKRLNEIIKKIVAEKNSPAAA